MTPLMFAKDMVAFPWAWATGTEYKDAEEKAHKFVYATTRVIFTCSVIWGLYRGQQCEALRKLTVPVALFTLKVGRVTLSLEPISLLINLYLIKTSQSKWRVGGYCAAVGVWQCIAQTFKQWTKEAPGIFFSATWQRGGLNIDPLSNLMRIALWKFPETRLGVGICATIFGMYQLNAYTTDRWNLVEAPTSLALKGIVHILFGLCWIAAFDNYNRRLEKGAKKDTYFCKAADIAAPRLAWLATGQRPT